MRLERRNRRRVPGHVLVVDDEPLNREIVRMTLEGDGYVVRECGSGEEALDRLADSTVDVVVMDLRMPGMSGIDVCDRIKSDPETESVPVLIVTAIDSREERLRGIEAGAADFLRKPLDLTDLRLRVRNALTSKRLYDEVQAEYARAVRLEDLRDNLVHMVAHDIKSPLQALRGNLELLRMDLEEGRPAAEALEEVSEAMAATHVVIEMIQRMLDVSRLESEQMPIDPGRVRVRDLCDRSAARLGPRGERVTYPTGDGDLPELLGDPELLTRVLVNLLDNAIDYSPADEPVRVDLTVLDGRARLSVVDRGPGIPEDMVERVFDKFAQVEGPTGRRPSSAGLGLAFCKLAVEAHDGSIGLVTERGRGSTFWFEVPTAPGGAEVADRPERSDVVSGA